MQICFYKVNEKFGSSKNSLLSLSYENYIVGVSICHFISNRTQKLLIIIFTWMMKELTNMFLDFKYSLYYLVEPLELYPNSHQPVFWLGEKFFV